MKQLARRYVYWKEIDKGIEQLSKPCQPCGAVETNHATVPVHPWDEPKGNWDLIHIDYAGLFQGRFFLIIVDAKSRWAEIKLCRKAPTSVTTIDVLSDAFEIHGYSCIMVTDNVTVFVIDQFKSFSKSLSHHGTQLHMDSLSAMYRH
jgi:hypothetical protein